MTTIASSQGAAEVINARRTESLDAPEIIKLIRKNTVTQFGQVNIVHLIEKSNLAVTLINENNEVLGFAAFLDHPQYEICDPANYEMWMRDQNFNSLEESTPLNSLFLHYFVAKTDYTIGCATEIMRTVFNAVPNLHFLFLASKKNSTMEKALAEVFEKVSSKNDGSSHDMYVCHRHDHVPVLHVRRAAVEDHDDLLPIFNNLDNTLTQTYGNYFLAEMIEAQDKDHHTLVAEYNGKAIAFMSISSYVNVELLQNDYELDAFHGLCKPHPDDKLVASRPTTPPSSPVIAKQIEKPASVSSFTSQKSVNERTASVASTSNITVTEVQKSDQAIAEETQDEITVDAESIVVEEEETDQTETPVLEESESTNVVFEEEPKISETFSQLSLVEENDDEITPHVFKPVYKGESNCFSIQLFAIDELHEMRSGDFLPHIFKIFPDKDFAAITISHMVPEFPLLQNFIRVTPQVRSYVKQELYLFHRNGNIMNFTVRPTIAGDMEEIKKLVSTIEDHELIIRDVSQYNNCRRDNDATEIQAFVAVCLEQIVGVALCRREEDIEYIRSHYNIEDFIYFNHHRRDEHAHLHHFALNPIFQHYSKHFFKEILRQGRKSCLYYPIFPPGTEDSPEKPHTIITGLNYLLPVRSRRQIQYPLEEFGLNNPSSRVLKEQPPYALYHLNRKLTLEPKVTINARVVVVGASTLGISLLETLCFCPHLRFNNITLISQHGLPNKLCTSEITYSDEALAKLSLRTWINVVKGMMTGIDRASKKVILDDDSCVFYDHLILCTGQQYHIPQPTGANLEEGATNHVIEPSEIERANESEAPGNVIAVNNVNDINCVSKWLEKSENENSKVIVYGNSIDAYLSIQLLLSYGVAGQDIYFLQPSASQPVTLSPDPFNEPVIFDMVSKAMEDAGVKVYSEHILAQWTSNPDTGLISSVSFTTQNVPLTLSCDLFLSFHPRLINHSTFVACNDACLVFDNRLVIDVGFCTNDPAIRAAGSLTKYARRYHAEDWSNHDGFNSMEIGFRLALTLLQHLDPTMEPEIINPDDLNNKLVPVFEQCKAFHGVLPAGFNYFHARKPGLSKPYAAQLASAEHGREIITGSTETDNYFRLHLNQFNCVETITCVVKDRDIPSMNLMQMYNIHERYLNNLLSRVDEGMIEDFYEFFAEPWVMAIFHDRFKDLKQEIRDLLSMTPSGGDNLSSLQAHVQQLVTEDPLIDKRQRKELMDFYKTTGQHQIISNRLLSFLSYNYYHLPMYAKPGMV